MDIENLWWLCAGVVIGWVSLLVIAAISVRRTRSRNQ